MKSEEEAPIDRRSFSNDFLKILEKNSKKNPALVKRIEEQIYKILRFPDLGKPLRHDMKNLRRVRIGSFVLVYRVNDDKIRFLDFDHHDKIYKKKW